MSNRETTSVSRELAALPSESQETCHGVFSPGEADATLRHEESDSADWRNFASAASGASPQATSLIENQRKITRNRGSFGFESFWIIESKESKFESWMPHGSKTLKVGVKIINPNTLRVTMCKIVRLNIHHP